MPLSVVGESMTWGEAFRLTLLLTCDPSSQVATAVTGLEYPLSREGFLLMDAFDSLEASRLGKKFRPRPRPKVITRQSAADAARIRARLRARGHGALLDRIEKAERN